MRESNNLVLDQVKTDTKNTKSNSELINQNIQNNYNIEKKNLIDAKDRTNIGIKKENVSRPKENEKIVNSNLFTKKSANSNIIANDNEAQFRIIANKFNEAVEVILELSEKVKKLEKIVNNSTVNFVKDNKRQSIFNIKTYAYIIVTILFIIGIFTFPIDLSLFKVILIDIIS